MSVCVGCGEGFGAVGVEDPRCGACAREWCRDCTFADRGRFRWGAQEFCAQCWVGPMRCGECAPGMCASAGCESVSSAFHGYQSPNKRPFVGRGMCCAALMYCLNKPSLCGACAELHELRMKLRATARLLVGLRRFRPKSAALLAQLPRDVLVYALIKQHFVL